VARLANWPRRLVGVDFDVMLELVSPPLHLGIPVVN
jgi:hypothetical protein